MAKPFSECKISEKPGHSGAVGNIRVLECRKMPPAKHVSVFKSVISASVCSFVVAHLVAIPDHCLRIIVFFPET